jgi:peptidoglycan/LPS O-acetylase OafA/YrhL
VITYDVAERTTPLVFLENLGFLQTVAGPPFGSNSPLWSLCNEFWYYLIFPCLLLAFAGRQPPWRRCLQVAVAVTALVLLGSEISLYFLIWLLGAVVRFLPPITWLRSRWAGSIAAVLAGGAALVTLAASRVWPASRAWDYLIGMTFAIWLYVVLHDERKCARGWYARSADTLAGCSYTLYVVHLPILVCMYALLLGSGRWLPTPAALAAMVLICLSVFVFAVLLAGITERRTKEVRAWIRSL